MSQWDHNDNFILLPELKLLSHWKPSRYRNTYRVKKESDFEVCPRCATPAKSVYDRRWVSLTRTATDARQLEVAQRNEVRTILLLDVIEHLEDPVAFLAELRSHFPALRHLLLTVPARQELFSNYDEFNGHFRRYDPALLRELLVSYILRT